MTARDMQLAFQQYLESQINYSLPPLISDDLFHFINEAIHEYVIERFKEFEQNQRVTDNIATLVVKQHYIATTYKPDTWSGGSYFIDSAALPSNFAHLLNQSSAVQKANSGNYTFEVSSGARQAQTTPTVYSDFTSIVSKNSFAQNDDVQALLLDPFHTTCPEEPLTTISSGNINVYTDSTFIVTGVIIDYLKEPAIVGIGIDSDLPDFTHREIVRMAVQKYLGTLSTNNQS